MKSAEVLSADTGTERLLFQDKTVAQINEWVENVKIVMASESEEDRSNPDYEIRMDALERAIQEYTSAPVDQKEETEKIVQERAQALLDTLKQGSR